MLFSDASCFYFVKFSLCREILHQIKCEWRSVTSTVSLKSGCAPELVDILEQGGGESVGISVVPQKL